VDDAAQRQSSVSQQTLPQLPSPLRTRPISAADALPTLSGNGGTLRSVFDLSSSFLAYLQRPA